MKNTSISPATLPSEAPTRKPLSEDSELGFDQLYLKKDYKGASQYLLKNKQLFESGIFHYNLGTVYTKMGDLAAARFHLEKAINEGYVNSASVNNLNYVKSQLDVDDLSTSTSVLDKFIDKSTSLPGAGYYSLTLLIILFVLLLVRFQKIQKKWVMALAFLVALSPVFFNHLYVKEINHAIALKELPLYEGPSKIFSEKGRVRAGSKIVLGEFKEGWFYVKFPVSLTGWISKDHLGLY